MPYDPVLAARIRERMADAPELTEKRMFGGIGWMIRGNMAVGASSKGAMIVRCAREDFAEWTSLPGASPMKRGAKPMTGWVFVDAEAVATDDALDAWVARGRSFAEALPPKG